MTAEVESRQQAARYRSFVGRATEQALFQIALAAPELPFQVLYVFGPGGIGKTSLLREYLNICQQATLPVVYLDARNLEPSQDSFLSALRQAMGMTAQSASLQEVVSGLTRSVVLVDTYERLASLDPWFCEVFVPQLPVDALLVVAGRQPPSLGWRTDPGLQVRAVSLRNLSPEESRVYLTKQGVPQERQPVVLQFTHGHPLALSLVADLFAQRPDTRFRPEAAPDVVKLLLEQLVQKVPGPAHRTALEACAIVHQTTEALLARMLAIPDVHELFQWLRELSFIESGPSGVFPHDLAREALLADLRWRNPDWYGELHHRARSYYAARLQQISGTEQERVLFDYIFLHRDNAVVRPFFAYLEEQGGMASAALTDVAHEADIPALVAMVAQHEGEESARLAQRWLLRQRRRVLVFRDTDQRPAGMLAVIALHEASAEDINADPGALAAWRYLQAYAPLRPGEGATLFRFWMDRDIYQAISSIQGLVFVNMVRHYLTTPGLAFTFLPCSQPDFWAPIFAYADLARLVEADFQVGGRHYGVYGHDWRAVPPMAWLDLLAQREITVAPRAPTQPRPSQPLVVLSQPSFTAAVRNALRHFSRPDILSANPLLGSRLVADRCGQESGREVRVTTLQELVKGVAESFRQWPREERLYLALHHTYFHPAPSQERAAEVLDMPFSTYRRHLKTAITRVSDVLWQQEIGPWTK